MILMTGLGNRFHERWWANNIFYVGVALGISLLGA